MKVFFLIALIAVTFTARTSELGPKFISHLNKKGHLVEREMVSNAPWPRVTVFMRLNATPEEAMALFSDFERQKEYVPGILKSVVVKQVSPLEVHTEYELKMPWPLSNSHYVHGTVITHKNNRYKISWYVVKSDSAEKIEGDASFESIDGTTYMTYHSLIYPKSTFAPFFANTMVSDTEKSTLAIRDFIEAQVKAKNDAFEHSLTLLRDSLAGKLVFTKKSSQ